MSPTIKARPGQRIRAAELRSLYDTHGALGTCSLLRDSLLSGALRPENFSLRALAEAFIPNWATALLPDPSNVLAGAEAAVDSTAFSNISQQLMYSSVLEGWREADKGLADRLCSTMDSKFSGEKIPGIAEIKDEAFDVPEGASYPESGVSEHYLETPPTTKRGIAISITKEAVFFDRTGLLIQRAQAVGNRLAMDKLKRILRVVIGAVNNYKLDGVATNTYLTSGAYTNDQSNELVDFRDIDESRVLFTRNVHPDTGNPLDASDFVDMLVSPFKEWTARRILSGTETRVGDGATSTPVTISENPARSLGLNLIVSALLPVLVNTDLSVTTAANANDKYWIAGNFKRAFLYIQNWPLMVEQAPPGAGNNWLRDILVQFKAGERGVAFCQEPRFVQRNKN